MVMYIVHLGDCSPGHKGVGCEYRIYGHRRAILELLARWKGHSVDGGCSGSGWKPVIIKDRGDFNINVNGPNDCLHLILSFIPFKMNDGTDSCPYAALITTSNIGIVSWIT